ncbi:MAG: acetylornithine/succinylornithine family transaminase [Oscillospiraceae bacterium]|nr:acetylornithine/succinylornithine family transaminase [Oscillospiraceae bacterium]
MNTFEKDKTYIAGTYKRFPVELVSGSGSLLRDVNGKRYIDMGSGIGVNCFGIGDDVWREAVTAQLGMLQHTSNLYFTKPCTDLAELICRRTGFKKVFFSNSGAEANECAIKAARKYAAEKKGADCNVILTMKNSFHGRTLTTLAATGQEHYHELYNPLTPGFAHVPAGDYEAFENAVSRFNVAAVMLECIQGEGGVIVQDARYLKQVSDFCAKHDILLIVDEVQTGNGRTGMLYSYMNFGISPDIVSTAKGLGGGLPIGATLLGEKVQNVFSFGDNGSTFGGNPVVCAGAFSIIQRLDDEFLAQVSEKGEYIVKTLSSAEGIESVSGMGLMIGIKTKKPAGEVVQTCLENGVLCLTAKDKVRLLPPLNIPMSLLREAVEIIALACKE